MGETANIIIADTLQGVSAIIIFAVSPIIQLFGFDHKSICFQ